MSRPLWGMAVSVAFILVYVIGWALLRLIRIDRSALGWVGRWTCAWMLGAYATSLCLFVLSLCGVRASIMGPMVLAVGLVAVVAVIDRPTPPSRPAWSTIRKRLTGQGPARLLIRTVSVCVMAWSLGRVAVHACAAPVNDWDGKAIYTLKAKALFDQPIPTCEYFRAMRLSFSHRHYPLLIPFLEVHIWTWVGEADDWAVMPLFPLFAAALVGGVYAFSKIVAGEWAALGAATIVATAPKVGFEAPTACCDVPLGAYVAVLVGAGAWALRSPSLSKFLLMAVMTAGAVFTKTEGTTNAAITLAAVLAAYLARTRDLRAVSKAAIVLALGFALNGPWLLFRSTIPPVANPAHASLKNLRDFLEQHPDRIVPVVASAIGQLGPTKAFGAFWLLVVAAVALFPRRLGTAEPLAILAILLLNLGMYFIGILSIGPPLDPSRMVVDVLPRLLTHWVGPAAILLAIQWSPSAASQTRPAVRQD